MKIAAKFPLAAPRERVYAALTDPIVLQRCIPGCEQLTLSGEDRFDARIKIGMAGLKGTYTGRAELRDRQPPDSFTLAVDGKGAPGFVRATSRMTLVATDAGTEVACDADVLVGGLIAAVGSRLIEAAARQLMAEFFRRLAAEFV